MEQYELLPGTWYKSLHYALKYFRTDYILLRTTGPVAGTVIVGERLDDKWLDLTKISGGLLVEINGQKRGVFNIQKAGRVDRLSGKAWIVVYERIGSDGLMFYASSGFPNGISEYTGPDDPKLPDAQKTIFISSNSDQYIEIVFVGKIPIVQTERLVSRDSPSWYYWIIDKTKTTK